VKYNICLIGVAFVVLIACNKQGNQPGAQAGQDSTAAKAAIDSAAAIPSNLTDSTKVRLAFRLHPGEILRYKEVTRTISEGKFNNFPSSAKDEMTSYFALKIVSMDSGGSFKAILTYDSILYSMQGDRGAMSFTSNDTTLKNDPRYAQWNYMIGVPIPITVSPVGEIVEVDSMKPIVERILALQPEEERRKLPPDAADELSQQMEETSVKGVAGNVFLTMPGKEITQDSTWSKQQSGAVDNLFPTINTTTYKISGYATQGARRMAHIEMALNVQILKKQAGDSTATVTLRNGSVTGEGSADLDLYRGVLSNKTTHIVISESLSSVGHGQYAAGKGDISKNITIETTLQAI